MLHKKKIYLELNGMFEDEYDKSDRDVSLAPAPPTVLLPTPPLQLAAEYLCISA